MSNMLKNGVILYFIFLTLVAAPGMGQSPVSTAAPARTVLDGVYSEAQAARGKAAYDALCGACHGDAMQGVSAPELMGDAFLEHWREGALEGLFSFIAQRMPRGRPFDAKPITESDYLDMLAYILKVNGYRAGAGELSHNLVGSVMLVGKNGPQPVPDGALVVTSGCLSEARSGMWVLSNAAEPVRTRTSITSTDAELKASSEKSKGSLTFRLTDLEAVADFVPEAHKGHKMQAKGFLIRQPNAERISLSSMEFLDSSCWP